MNNNSEVKYIAIEGVIGVGKTALAKKIKERLNAELILEQFETNPFLENFYSNRKRYAFQTQMFFLINRFKQQEELNQGNLFTEYVVSDYIFEKDRIFAYLNLSGEELKLYESIFPLLERNLRKPDLIVYLQSSVDRLMYNIKKRGRKMERNLTRSYIEELNEAYNNFFFKFNNSPLLIVNASDIDFVQKEEDFNELFKQIFREDRGFTEYFKPETRRFLLYLLLFFIVYFVVKLVFRSLVSPSKTTINNSKVRKKETKYENVEDAKYTEINSDEEKKNNN